MKYLKLMLMVGALTSTTCLKADEASFPVNQFEHTCKPENSCEHLRYIAYEEGGREEGYPSVGYRIQKGKNIWDLQFGYMYFPVYHEHLGKIAFNSYYAFYKLGTWQAYMGTGVELKRQVWKSSNFKKSPSFTLFSPTVTIGHDFKMEKGKKIFMELIYRPASMYRGHWYANHSCSYRIGVGF